MSQKAKQSKPLENDQNVVTSELTAKASESAFSIVLSSLECPNVPAQDIVGGSLLRLLNQVSWLSECLRSRLDLDSLVTDLQQKRKSNLPKLSGVSAEYWAVEALDAGSRDEITGLAHLCAIFVLAGVDRQLKNQSALSLATLKRLGALLKSISKRSGEHPDRMTLHHSKQNSSAADYCFSLATSLRTNSEKRAAGGKVGKTPLQELWDGSLSVWANVVFANAPIKPPSEGTHPSGSKGKSTSSPPKPRGSRTPAKVTKKVSYVPIDKSGAPEPGEDDGSAVIDVTSGSIGKRQRRLTAQIERSVCFKQIRMQNGSMSLDHIEVLSRVEVETRVEKALEQFDSAIQNQKPQVAEAAEAILDLLLVATGRPVSALTEILIRRNPVEVAPGNFLQLCLESGCMIQPVFVPTNAYTPELEELKKLLEPTLSHLPLPIPPALMSRVRQLYSLQPITKIAEWLVGSRLQKNIEQQQQSRFKDDHIVEVRQLLKESADEKDAIGMKPLYSVARARRWLGCILYDENGDSATTMQICADSAGRSTAPTYYCSTTVERLQRRYLKAIRPAFGGDFPEPQKNSGRIGSRGLVKLEIVHRGLDEIARKLNRLRKPKDRSDLAGLAKIHNIFTTYVIAHWTLLTMHRPTKALFEIFRDDIDLEGMLAVISDKRVDAAHYFRLVALTHQLTRQIEAYLSHTRALAKLLPQQVLLASHCEAVVAGSKPLFFFLDEKLAAGGIVSIETTLQIWKRHWPTSWQLLADNIPNWYRHFSSSHLRELGLPGWQINLQLGHLEASNFPFSDSSSLVATTLPTLYKDTGGQLEKQLKLTVRWGLGNGRIERHFTGLSDYQSLKERSMKNIEEMEKARDKLIERRDDAAEAMGKQLGLKVLREINTSLADLIETNPQSVAGEARIEACRFDQEAADQLISSIESADEEAHIKIAAQKYLSSQLQKVATKYRFKIARLSRMHTFPQQPASPFFSRMMRALGEIRFLRDQFRRLDETSQSSATICAAVAILFGRISDCDELIKVLKGEGTLSCSRSTPPIGIVDLGEQGAAFGLDALTSLALAKLKKEGRSDYFNGDLSLIGNSLKTMLLGSHQKKARGAASAVHQDKTLFTTLNGKKWLMRLLETVEVVNRVELSPIGRLACSTRGSVAACAALQQGVLGADLPPMPAVLLAAPAASNTESTEATLLEDDDDKPDKPLQKDMYARANRKLKKIRAACSQRSGKTGRKGKKDSYKRPQKEMITELMKLAPKADQTGPLMIEDALAGWALTEAEGWVGVKGKAPSSIQTYLSTMGKQLVELLVGFDLHELDADDLGEVYEHIAQASNDLKTSSRTAAQLVSLHRYLCDTFGFERCSTDVLTPFLGRTERSVTPNFSLASEAKLARQWLDKEIDGGPMEGLTQCEPRRLLRACKVISLLMEKSGARISEIALLRHSDVMITESCVQLFIRPSRYRRLKTGAGRRRIVLTKTLKSQEERDVIVHWQEGERTRLGRDLTPQSLMFGQLDNDRLVMPVGQIRTVISRSFLEGAGRYIWPHLFRHQWVQERLFPAVWSERIATGYDWWASQRRLDAVYIEVGHSILETTFQCYWHLPWLLRSAEAALQSDVSRSLLCVVSKQKDRTVDQAKQRVQKKLKIKPSDPSFAIHWPARLLKSSTQRTSKDRPIISVKSPTFLTQHKQVSLEFSLVERMFRASKDEADFRRIGLVTGLLSEDIDELLVETNKLAKTSFLRLLPTPSRKSKSREAKRLDGLIRTPIPRAAAVDPTLAICAGLCESKTDATEKALSEFVRSYRPSDAVRANWLPVGPENSSFFEEMLKLIPDLFITTKPIDRSVGSDERATGLRPRSNTYSDFDLFMWRLGVVVVVRGARRSRRKLSKRHMNPENPDLRMSH